MASKQEKFVYVPDTMSDWPWPAKFNPLCDEVEAEAVAWIESLQIYTPESFQAHLKTRVGRLAAHVYPDAPHGAYTRRIPTVVLRLIISRSDRLRVGVDLLHMLFVIDEYTDMEPSAGVHEISGIILDALRNPDKPRPEGEPPIGEMVRQFWARGRVLATPEGGKHLFEAFADYLHGAVLLAEDREKRTIRTVDAYMEARRLDSGVRLSFSPSEIHLSIPDEAFYHPVVKELQEAIVDLALLDNDVASYNREQASCYENWNILSVVMHQFDLDLYHAAEWVAKYHKTVQARFLDALTRLPSFNPAVDAALQEYVAGMAAWPRGNDLWRFESERYFGKNGAEVRRSGRTPLLAKREMDPELRRENVKVLLFEDLKAA